MDKYKAGFQSFHLVNQHMQKSGLDVSRETIGDPSIINAPSATQNKVEVTRA